MAKKGLASDDVMEVARRADATVVQQCQRMIAGVFKGEPVYDTLNNSTFNGGHVMKNIDFKAVLDDFRRKSVHARHREERGKKIRQETEVRDEQKRLLTRAVLDRLCQKFPGSPIDTHLKSIDSKCVFSRSEATAICDATAKQLCSAVASAETGEEVLMAVKDISAAIQYGLDSHYRPILNGAIYALVRSTVPEKWLQKSVAVLKRSVSADEKRKICRGFSFPVSPCEDFTEEQDVRLFEIARYVLFTKHSEWKLSAVRFIENFDHLSDHVPKVTFQRRVLKALAALEGSAVDTEFFYSKLGYIGKGTYDEFSESLNDYGVSKRYPGDRSAELAETVQYWLKFRRASATAEIATKAALESLQPTEPRRRF